MILATATPDLSTFTPPNLAAQAQVLSTQALSAIVAQPFDRTVARPSTMAAVVFNGQALPAATQGFSATATNTGWGSTSQAAVCVSFNLAQPAAAKPAR
jgi:hypothetical protein